MAEQNRIFWPGWETGAIIGRGSFGEVYEIHRDVFGTREQAALKVITIPQNVGDIDAMYSEGYDEGSITSSFQNQLESIIREYTLMHSMSSCPHIVRCDDVRYIQHDDGIGWDVFIKMELLTPLTKVPAQNVTEEMVIQVGMDICRALERCGRQQIIHRDIKPQNILLSAEGICKLGDFGIAKTVERTIGGTKTGSYDYMAPEVNFFQPYNGTVDIYSLGLVLYWLLNERRGPFLPLPPGKILPAMKEEAWKRRMQGEALPPPAHGSEQLKAIVLKACAYRSVDRYASATEMLNALQALTKPHPEPTPEPTPTFDPEPLDDIWVQQPPVVTPPAENLDVRQTLQFAYEDNPAGNVVNVQVGTETVQVWIPEQFENGQTFYYEGMGLKSAYSEARGNLYLTIHVTKKPKPAFVAQEENLTANQKESGVPEQTQKEQIKLKKNKKWLFMGVLALGAVIIILLTMLGGKRTGTCGNGVQWKVDDGGKRLTISGSGAMDDYNSVNSAPWGEFKDDITYIVIEPGVTHIGSNAFHSFNNLNSVTFVLGKRYDTTQGVYTLAGPESIGDWAFQSCGQLKEIRIPSSVKEIGYGAFYRSGLMKVELSVGLERIEASAFAQTSITSVAIPYTVIYCAENAFNSTVNILGG